MFTETTSGEDPGEGGTETVRLDRQASNLRIDVQKEEVTKTGTEFSGGATHGNVEVDDTFANTGTGFSGSLSFSDRLTRLAEALTHRHAARSPRLRRQRPAAGVLRVRWQLED
jgi:hypothetical protein